RLDPDTSDGLLPAPGSVGAAQFIALRLRCRGAGLCRGGFPELLQRGQGLFGHACLAPLVLRVHGSDVQHLRLLRLVWMLAPPVNAQLFQLGTAKGTRWHHTLHGLVDCSLRMATGENLLHGAVLDTAGMAGVPIEALLLQL